MALFDPPGRAFRWLSFDPNNRKFSLVHPNLSEEREGVVNLRSSFQYVETLFGTAAIRQQPEIIIVGVDGYLFAVFFSHGLHSRLPKTLQTPVPYPLSPPLPDNR